MTRATLTALLVLFLIPAAAWPAEGGDRRIRIFDDCEQASFDDAIGDGTCVGDGRTTFEDFIAELQETQTAEDWNFDRERTSVKSERALRVENHGGEVHSFTAVAEFGGGFIDILNELSGNPQPAPECLEDPSDTNVFLGPGGSVTLPAGDDGERNFMCCIHPWMRSTVAVR